MADQIKSARPYMPDYAGSRDAAQNEWSDVQDIDPNQLLDGLLTKMRLENDAALANKLQVIQPIIRMLRAGTLSMSPPMLMAWIAEATSISATELRALVQKKK